MPVAYIRIAKREDVGSFRSWKNPAFSYYEIKARDAEGRLCTYVDLHCGLFAERILQGFRDGQIARVLWRGDVYRRELMDVELVTEGATDAA